MKVLIRDTDLTSDTVSSQTQEPSLDSEKPSSSEQSPSANCTNNETDCTPGEVTPSEPIATSACVDNQTETCNRPISSITECTDNETSCAHTEKPLVTCGGNETGCTTAELPPITCKENNTNCNIVEQVPPVTGQCEGNDTICISTEEPPTPNCPGAMTGNMTGASCNPHSQPVSNCPDNFGNITGNMTNCTPLERENIPPNADAGEDQTADEDSLVTLDGNNSYDKDGNITSYSWIQDSGNPSIIISGADSPSATFTVPKVDNDTNFRMELTVTDSHGAFDSDYVNVLVRNTNNTVIPQLEGKITLDEIPNQITAGSIFVFSGRLEISGLNHYNNSNIQIRSINNGTDNDLLSFNAVDNDGQYVVEWTAAPKETPYEVQAIYEDSYGRILKSDAQTFRVIENKSEILLQSESLINGPYIPLIYFRIEVESELKV